MNDFNKLAEKFEYWCAQPLVVIAKAVKKSKEKKKLDPSAGVRNRGTVCVPASTAKDKKDHFPINSIGQARNALARVHQYSSVPSWYKGTLKSLQELVSRKVHSKYPSIGKEDKKKSKKSSLEVLVEKYADNKDDMFVKCPVCKEDRLTSTPAHAKVHARQCAKKHDADISKYKSFIEEAEGKSKKSSLEVLVEKYGTDETTSIVKTADPQAFSQIVSQYEDSADCVRDFAHAMKLSAEQFARESDMNDPKDRRIYDILLKAANVVFDTIPELEALDQEMEKTWNAPNQQSDEEEV